MKRIIFWTNYGSSSSKYVLERFSEEGHGVVFSDEYPSPVLRESSVLVDFIEGDSETLLFLTRDKFVSDLVALLAAQSGVQVMDLPKWDALTDNGTRVLNLEEDFESLLGSLGGLTPYVVGPGEAE